MKHDYYIEQSELVLKPLEFIDLEYLRTLRNKNRMFFVNKQKISKKNQEKWFKYYLTKEDDFMFSVVVGKITVGFLGLYNFTNDSAEFGRIVIDETAPRYTAARAICLLLDFFFEKRRLSAVVCSVLKDNSRAKSLYELIGFKKYDESESLIYYKTTKNSNIKTTKKLRSIGIL